MRSFVVDTTPLRVSPAYRRLWWGLSISNLGAQLTVVAVGLQVYDITGSTASVGVLGLCALVPLIFFGLYGGAISDHHDRRRVALVASVVAWAATIGLAVQGWLGNSEVWVLFALTAVQSGAFAVNSPARSAIIPRLLEPSLLPAANALQTLGFSVAFTVGPLLGAALVAAFDYGVAYTLDALLFTAALAALFRLPPQPPEPSDTRRERAGLASVVDGFRYLGTQRNVRMTFAVDLVAMITSSPRVLFPAVGMVYLGGGATTTGVLVAATAVGVGLAGLFSGGLTRIRWQGRIIAIAITAWGLAIAAFGLTLVVAGRTHPDQVVWLALVIAVLMLVVAGASDAISSVFRQTILQTATPDDMRGRLQGVFIVVVAGGPRLGEALLGGAASKVGEGWAAVIGGSLCVVLLWLLVRTQRSFWNYDARHPVP
ncbi:MFS transporter [Cellulomonas fengjieae]|uniref:MFS transporter n=1 Tax=Cellulomonas fengjieae TaxID=2819978 RepID=A0ABS3SHT7_9CELL|nr:MFS transporter [Cellulomonas fengjieae]MBO3085217.1 MFS transporter [Cellulomonas fengjieae]MBO3100959.1 MFS transporter [Cellulomonas fengjieae]QVI66216.1 MFS transporter [Cellulomonas fengjieae]